MKFVDDNDDYDDDGVHLSPGGYSHTTQQLDPAADTMSESEDDAEAEQSRGSVLNSVNWD